MNRADISRANLALARAARTEIANSRYERFKEIRKGDSTIQQAAWELGISRRQAERYSVRQKAERENGN